MAIGAAGDRGSIRHITQVGDIHSSKPQGLKLSASLRSLVPGFRQQLQAISQRGPYTHATAVYH
jgi:hypothetical protein